MKHNNTLKLDDIPLLRLGRHFRVDGSKIVIGRNKKENERLLSIVGKKNWLYLEVVDYMGPIAVLESNFSDFLVEKAAQITIRYSDAKENVKIRVKVTGGKMQALFKLMQQVTRRLMRTGYNHFRRMV